MKALYTLITLITCTATGMYAMDVGRRPDIEPSSFADIEHLVEKGNLTYEVARTFLDKHVLTTTEVSNFLDTTCLKADFTGEWTLEAINNESSGLWLVRECNLFMAQETKKNSKISRFPSDSYLAEAQRAHKRAQNICMSRHGFKKFIEEAEKTETFDDALLRLQMIHLFSLFTAFRYEERIEPDKEMEDYYLEKKTALNQLFAKMCIGSEVMKEFRRGTLTIKRSKRILDGTYPATGPMDLTISINEEDGKKFCEAYRQDILDAGEKLLKNQISTTITQLENIFAALWFLLKCERARTVMADKHTEAVNALIFKLINAEAHNQLIAYFAFSEDGDQKEAIILARIGALFATTERFRSSFQARYEKLIEGKNELALSFYTGSYRGIYKDEKEDKIDSPGRKTGVKGSKARRFPAFNLKKVLPWAGALLGVAALAVGGALAYKKYGTKKPQPKTTA